MIAQSGNPFSIYASRNPLPGSGLQTANTTLSGSALDQVVRFHIDGSGPSVIAASAIGPDGSAFGAPSPAFTNPVGGPGILQARRFTGPSVFDLDFGMQKRFPIGERLRTELRFEGINILNHPTFFPTDQYIGDSNFGRSFNTVGNSVATAGTGFFQPRRIQFSMYLRF
jgi:hypothetical protein